MKKTTLLLVIFVISIFSAAIANADVIPMNSHPVSKCAKITNIGSFQDYVIVAQVNGPGGGDELYSYIVSPDACLEKGYKFNGFKVYAVKKSYFDSVAKTVSENPRKPYAEEQGIKTVDYLYKFNKSLDTDTNFVKANIDIEPYGGYVKNTNSLTKIEIDYSIEKITDAELVLKEARQSKVKERGKYNIFTSIWCFFKGGRC